MNLRSLLSFALVLNSFISYTQDSARLYLNLNFEAVEDPSNAEIIRDASIKNNRYYITDQFVDGRMIMKGEYNSVDPWIEDGRFVFYDRNGKKYAEGDYKDGIMTGTWVYYDSTRTDTVLYNPEWVSLINDRDKVGAFEKFTYFPKEASDFIKSTVHYPGKFLFDCKNLPITADVLYSKQNLKEFRISGEPPIDFKLEAYRSLLNIPESLFMSKKQNNTRYYLIVNFICDQSVPKKDPNIDECTLPAFVFVDEMATFNGGSLENFRDWVQGNLIYPPKSVEMGESGRITVQFTVTVSGHVDCIKILQSSGSELLDNEAIRVIRSSPLWIPARSRAQIVNQQFVMPVIFQILDEVHP